jgi:trehalose 6-phosphate synthase
MASPTRACGRCATSPTCGRPSAPDWAHYVAVNRKFAEAVVARRAPTNPIVLVQDYHFALLPRMIRERTAAGDGHHLLAHSLAQPGILRDLPVARGDPGRHAGQQHPRLPYPVPLQQLRRHRRSLLEARVDRESFTVSFGGELTAVRRYPISIEWPPGPAMLAKAVASAAATCAHATACRRHTAWHRRRSPRLHQGHPRTLRAVERLLELKPEWIGRFSFIQIAAPTRASIEDYQQPRRAGAALAARINERFARAQPAARRSCSRSSTTTRAGLRATIARADCCFVSSLHDGMNLVAKEFVAARDDERGVLILSQFTGAARELPEALIVNPYDIRPVRGGAAPGADHAGGRAARPDAPDARPGREFNVYRWAGRMLLDAAAMRRRGRPAGKAVCPGTAADPLSRTCIRYVDPC